MADKVIELMHVYKEFVARTGLIAREERRGLIDVNMYLGRQEIVGLVGESGAGKTVVAWIMVGLLKPTRGSVMYYPMNLDVARASERQLREYRKHVQLVFQDPYASLDPTHTVRWHIERALKVSGYRGDYDSRIAELLKLVGLTPPEDYVNKYPFQLSGGQRQRVYLARVMALEPDVIVADEPVSNVDASIRASLLDLFKMLNEQKKVTMLYITHDIATVGYITDRVYVMKEGRIVEEGPTEEVLTHPRHEYTKLLIESVPNPYRRIEA